MTVSQLMAAANTMAHQTPVKLSLRHARQAAKDVPLLLARAVTGLCSGQPVYLHKLQPMPVCLLERKDLNLHRRRPCPRAAAPGSAAWKWPAGLPAQSGQLLHSCGAARSASQPPTKPACTSVQIVQDLVHHSNSIHTDRATAPCPAITSFSGRTIALSAHLQLAIGGACAVGRRRGQERQAVALCLGRMLGRACQGQHLYCHLVQQGQPRRLQQQGVAGQSCGCSGCVALVDFYLGLPA